MRAPYHTHTTLVTFHVHLLSHTTHCTFMRNGNDSLNVFIEYFKPIDLKINAMQAQSYIHP